MTIGGNRPLNYILNTYRKDDFHFLESWKIREHARWSCGNWMKWNREIESRHLFFFLFFLIWILSLDGGCGKSISENHQRRWFRVEYLVDWSNLICRRKQKTKDPPERKYILDVKWKRILMAFLWLVDCLQLLFHLDIKWDEIWSGISRPFVNSSLYNIPCHSFLIASFLSSVQHFAAILPRWR